MTEKPKMAEKTNLAEKPKIPKMVKKTKMAEKPKKWPEIATAAQNSTRILCSGTAIFGVAPDNLEKILNLFKDKMPLKMRLFLP